MVFQSIAGGTNVFIPQVSLGILELNQNKRNKETENFNSPMISVIGGLIPCRAKKATEIATVTVMNREPTTVSNVLLNQIEWKKPK
jgi:hypothetical protein